MRQVKRTIQKLVRSFGYDLTRFVPDLPGRDPYADMRRLSDPSVAPVIFDVGANLGQSVRKFKDAFPKCTIHSFEPSPRTFLTLRENVKFLGDLHLWNCALASTVGELILFENCYSDMSSLLKPGEFAWGEVETETIVEVQTVDSICALANVERIDILKSDTQGYELEVFKGAARMMAENRIGLIFAEVMFREIYEGMPSFDQLYGYLTARNFALVSFYQFHFQRGMVSWTDALFINEQYDFGKR